MTADERLAKQIAEFYDDPAGYVMFNWPWDTDISIQKVPLREPYLTRFREQFPNRELEWGPDIWALEFLDDLGREIKDRAFDGIHNVDPIRFSTVSGHGIGKSTLVAWLIFFILDTRPFSKGVVTANTSDQLRTKTWSELAKWHHLALTSHFWDYVNSRGNMSVSRRGKPEIKQRWRCDAITCRPENAESFQGLHAADSTPFYIFDEASGIENEIWEARFGGATDGEPMSFDFGNPTRKSGYFYENCVGSFKHRYIVRQIDSRSVYITNKKYFEDAIADYGADSDFVKVKIKGEFPTSATVQFIGDDLVNNAMSRPGTHQKDDPIVIGVDCARYGDNDTVIFPRIGDDAKSFPYIRLHGVPTTKIVEEVAKLVNEFRAKGKEVSGIFVDGGGLGSGPVDQLRALGYNPIDVNFGGKATDNRYNRWGDQMWGELRDALIRGRLALPHDLQLKDQLCQREYYINEKNGKIQLESKADMSERGVPSPDMADALVLTYAQKVNSLGFRARFGQQTQVAKSDYNPLEATW